MLDPRIVFIGAAATFGGALLYSWQTFKGKAQPNRVTWILWGLAPLLAFADEISQGVGLQSVMTLFLGLGPICVLTASFMSKSATWKLRPFDLVCGSMSIVGIVIWAVTANATIAFVAFMVADGLAGLPTLLKAFREPETERIAPYAAGVFNALVTLATVTKWTTAEAAFPIQILIMDSVLVTLITTKVGARINHRVIEPVSHLEHVLPPRREEDDQS